MSRAKKQDQHKRSLAEPVTGAGVDSPTEEEVKRRAYEIYLARGGEPGYDLDDWLQAERELRERRARTRSE